MMELNEQLQQALDDNAGKPLRLVAPRTNQSYVLVRSEVYDRVKAILEQDDEWEAIDVGTLIAEAMRDDDTNDPLLESYQKSPEIG
jgi:hypothetical protein